MAFRLHIPRGTLDRIVEGDAAAPSDAERCALLRRLALLEEEEGGACGANGVNLEGLRAMVARDGLWATARRLQLDPANLSKMLCRRRAITPDRARRLHE